jgi:hypothetical protein
MALTERDIKIHEMPQYDLGHPTALRRPWRLNTDDTQTTYKTCQADNSAQETNIALYDAI